MAHVDKVKLIAFMGFLSLVAVGSCLYAPPADRTKKAQPAHRVRPAHLPRPARKEAGIFGTNIQLSKAQEQEANRLFEQYRAQLYSFANLCGTFPSVFLNRTPGEWDSCMDDSFMQLRISLQGIRDFVLDAWRRQQRGMSPALLEKALREKGEVIDTAIRRMLRQQRADWKHLTYSATGGVKARGVLVGIGQGNGARPAIGKKPVKHLL
jgi:hypothetical protein